MALIQGCLAKMCGGQFQSPTHIQGNLYAEIHAAIAASFLQLGPMSPMLQSM